MSASTRLGVIAGITTTSAAAVGILSLPAVQSFISRHLGPNSTKYTWRLLLVIFAWLNLKNLPFFWHFRVFRGIFYQLYLQPTPQKPKHLFAPIITSSFNTIYDCDYNFHKSNSTYFADLDVARANFVACIIRTGLARLNKGDREGLPEDVGKEKGKYMIALGGISCFFRRQIEPLQGFEIYTRLLAWDRKWLYCVSHIVRKGAIKPKSYVLQPWKKVKRKQEGTIWKEHEEGDLTKHIFATSVARYVFKKGRMTINPEIVLERSKLLPLRPAGVDLPPRAEAEWNGDSSASVEKPLVNGEVASESDAASKGASDDEGWTWDDMEKERLRGLKIANHFDSLSAVQNELQVGEVLGQYGDYW